MQKGKPTIARRLLFLSLIVSLLWPIPASWAVQTDVEKAPGRVMAQQAVKEKPLWITSDHSKHEILKQPFASAPDVTSACLSCHNQAALQFQQTIHWTWMDPSTAQSAQLGKGGLSINNF